MYATHGSPKGSTAKFDTFIPMGTKEAKVVTDAAVAVIFKTYSLGVSTNRDAWARNFNRNALAENMNRLIGTYNAEIDRWKRRENRDANVDDFVVYDNTKIKWSRDLKLDLKRSRIAEYAEGKVKNSLYRPFTKSNLFFDRVMNEEVYSFPSIFPTPETEQENRVICVAGIGDRKGFGCLTTNRIPSIDLAFEKAQCFPFYTYDEDGEKPPRKHHRLGVRTIPGTLPRRYHRQVGHLSLCLRPAPSPDISGTVSGEPQAGPAASAVWRPTFALLPKRDNGWGKSTSAMKTQTNIG